ncbi:hypothetical protein [Vagococcus acidifermentans]|uniref:Uncharacterized protein n=1 Tax=Vagococcus acidifermentans TaxID=564710 RepID=A0A430B0B7_9ENTE|nr:hypothetical protein [Vagococcus acidifermentans]RSU13764.1 hypothetical protein CBF27_02370 [Vagococcus acidifermentans]
MKKTNFVVVFWLILAIISFVVCLINLQIIWDAIGYLIFPDKNDFYFDSSYTGRRLINSVPMTIITIISFYLSLRQGLNIYKEN